MMSALEGAKLKPDERHKFRRALTSGEYFFDGMVLNRNRADHK
jgi:hypothetical protein